MSLRVATYNFGGSESLFIKNEVYCLQNVVDVGRKEIEMLLRARYALVFVEDSGSHDSFVALQTEKFSIIENRSFLTTRNSDVAVAVTKNRQTAEKIAYVSFHLRDPYLASPLSDQTNSASNSQAGDEECETMLVALNKKCSDCAAIIIGTDIKTSPERDESRFAIFKKYGFRVVRSTTSTGDFAIKFNFPLLAAGSAAILSSLS